MRPSSGHSLNGGVTGGDRLDEEAAEPAERFDDPDGPPAEALEGPQRRGDGRLSHACARRYTPRAQSGK